MKIKKLLFTTLTFSIGSFPITISSCSTEKAATDISDIVGEDSVAVNEKSIYYAALLPKDTNDKIIWSVDNTSFATIDENTGELFGISVGEVNVTATCSSNQSITRSKTVLIIPERTREIDIIGPDNVSLYSKDISFRAKITPDYLGDSVQWSIDDEEVASIDKETGKLDTKEMGSVKIIATSTKNPNVSGSKYIYITNPKPISWETDDWRTIAFYAEQGIDALADAYPDEYKSENAQTHKIKNSFIGSTKQMVIDDPLVEDNSYSYNFRVIGTEYDTIAESSQKATLTWELNNLITTNGDPWLTGAHPIPWTKYAVLGEMFDNAWMVEDNVWSSDVRKYFIDTMEHMLTETLGENTIKTVIKKTPSGLKLDNVVESEEKLFPLSINEIYSSEVIYSHALTKEKADIYTQCGEQYQFFKNAIGDKGMDVEIDELKKQGIDKEIERYWLRTPYITNEDCVHVWHITSDGKCETVKTKQDDSTSTYMPYSFCFCM